METEVSDLRRALYRGDRDSAHALVAAGATVNAFDAAALGDVDRLKAMLAADPDLVREWSADGFTALHFAAYLGGAEVVRLLIEAGSDVHAVARNDMLVQPLHSAAALGDVTACELLLKAGADPNATQQAGFVPLDEALVTHNEALAALLTAHGARVSGNHLPD